MYGNMETTSYHSMVNIDFDNMMIIKLSLYPGEVWCISGDNLDCQTVVGWDYAEDFIWPNTDTLYIIGKGILSFLLINEIIQERSYEPIIIT